MRREEREALRESIAWLKPGMHVEIMVRKLRELLEAADAAEARIRELEQRQT